MPMNGTKYAVVSVSRIASRRRAHDDERTVSGYTRRQAKGSE